MHFFINFQDSLYKIRFGSMTVREFREHMDSNDGLFTDVKEYEDIIRLLSGSMDLKTGRFNPNSRCSNIFLWNEDQALECRMNYAYSSVFISNKPILLGGFYCAPISEVTKWRNTQVDMTITEEPKDKTVDKSMPKPILSKQIKLSVKEETYVELSGEDEHPIVIKPDFKYRINFKPSTPTNDAFVLTLYNHCREIELGPEIKIQFPQETSGEDRSVIKCFKFNRL